MFKSWQRVCKKYSLNLLKPTGNFTYHKASQLKLLRCDDKEFVCFVWISEQTAYFSPQNLKNWFL